MSYRNKKVLFYDKGLYLYTAQKLGEYYDKVYYYMPDSSPYPCSNLADIGTGLPEVERVHNFWEYIDKVDMIVFPDVHDGNLQSWLRSKGYTVFGSGKSEELELDKIKFFDALEEAKLPIANTIVVTGTDELVEYLKGKTDRYIKTPTYRGDFETYHYTSMSHFEPWLDDLKYRLGSRCQKIDFIVQSPIKSACECYDKYTEVLTSNGWKFFDQLDTSDAICTLNPSTLGIEYQYPTDYIKKISDKICKLSNQKLDFAVTCDHSMSVIKGSDRRQGIDNVRLIKLSDLPDNDLNFIPNGNGHCGVDRQYFDLPRVDRCMVEYGRLPMRPWLRFLGWFLSDGCTVDSNHVVYISQVKPLGVKEIESTLTELGFKFDRNGHSFRVSSKQLSTYLKDLGVKENKRVPAFVKTLSIPLIQEFLSGYFGGNGTLATNGATRIYCTGLCKDLANDIQELIILTGKSSTISVKKPQGWHIYAGRNINSTKPVYNVSEQSTRYRTFSKKSVTIEDYNDFVYCVTVPNHIIQVRRNGKAMWCGNCGYDGYVVDGKFTTNCLCGYEVKDQAYVCKVFDATPKIIDDVNIAMSPYLKDCRGHYSTEIRINDKGKGYFIDPTCYSDDTEVLTNQGWKFFNDLNGTETICTLNPETRQIEYHAPSKYISYQYSGKMVGISSPKKTLELLVTPNHSVWGSERVKTNPIKEFRADSIPSKLLIPRTGEWAGVEQDTFTIPAYHVEWHSGKGVGIDKEYDNPAVDVPMDDWLRFLAIYLGDGSCSKYSVCVTQFDKVAEYEKIISKLPFNYSRADKGFNIYSVQLRAYLKQFGVCDQKFVPDYVKQLSPRQIKVFLDAYILGDGEKRESGSKRIFTTSPQLADDMQELFLKSGSVADIHIKKVKGSTMTCAGRSYVRKRDSYVISERATFDTCWVEGQASCRSSKYISEHDYDGWVYDVEVPNHILYVRRNGKPCFSGNCRIPSPPGELMCEIYSNYAESFYDIATGKLPELSTAKLYGAEFILTSDWNDKHELCVEYPSDLSQWVKLKNHVKRGKNTYCIPNGNGGFFGAVVGLGTSLKSAIQNVVDVAEQVKAEGFKFDSSVFDEANNAVKAGEQFGIKY